MSQNKPVIVTGATRHWPALARWSDPAYLDRTAGGADCTVSFSRDGYGDAPHDGLFVKSQERTLLLRELLARLADARAGRGRTDCGEGVPYLSAQNDSLRRELSALLPDCADGLRWASAALGCEPEATNIWARLTLCPLSSARVRWRRRQAASVARVNVATRAAADRGRALRVELPQGPLRESVLRDLRRKDLHAAPAD